MTDSTTGTFVSLTESWDMPMPVIEQDMLFRRYQVLADLATGQRLLEIGCGSAMGNDVLVEVASHVCSFDFEPENARRAAAHSAAAVGVADAQRLPFAAASFEMIYYVPDQDAMVAEVARVLAPGGVVFLAMANPERPAFHTSPHSTRYPTARDAAELLARHGLEPEVFGVFPLSDSALSKVLRLAIRIANALHLGWAGRVEAAAPRQARALSRVPCGAGPGQRHPATAARVHVAALSGLRRALCLRAEGPLSGQSVSTLSRRGTRLRVSRTYAARSATSS
jgi:SAM-dependent methyltransferase